MLSNVGWQHSISEAEKATMKYQQGPQVGRVDQVMQKITQSCLGCQVQVLWGSKYKMLGGLAKRRLDDHLTIHEKVRIKWIHPFLHSPYPQMTCTIYTVELNGLFTLPVFLPHFLPPYLGKLSLSIRTTTHFGSDFVYLFYWGDITGGALDLNLVVGSGITPGRARGPMWWQESKLGWSYVRQAPHLLSLWLSFDFF